jgi:hypothetical protein
MKMMMQPGKFYIGDLCYVMHKEWDEVCDLTISGLRVLGGFFNLSDGRKFGMWITAYGDGIYNDNLGNCYPVDAGLIGIIALEDIDESEKENLSLGNIIAFDHPFEVECTNGIFKFGHIIIDTASYDYEYGEDYAD